MYLLPVTPLWYEAVATNDALSYLRAEGTLEDEQAADRLLYPAYGTYVGNALSNVAPVIGTPLFVAGALGGHLAGRLQARRLAAFRSIEPSSPSSIEHANDEAASAATENQRRSASPIEDARMP